MPFDENTVDLTSDIHAGALDQGQQGTQPQVINTGGVQAPPGTLPAALAGQEQQQQPTLRDQLSSAFAAPTDPNAPMQGQQPNDHAPGELLSNRNADGTFKSSAQFEADKAKAATAAPAQGQQQQQATQRPTVPVTLPPAEAQIFASLPVEMQQLVARTMASADEYANSHREYGALQQVMTPQRVQMWAMDGLTPVQAHQQLYALSDFARTDPQNFLVWFAEQRGIDIGRLAQGYVPPDPALSALQQQLAAVQGQVQQFQGQQQAQVQDAIVGQIEQFATAKDAAGNPLRPYWDELTADILPFIQAERARNPNGAPQDVLTAAYDRACWGNPDVRAKMQAAADASALAGRRQQATAAQAAASSVTGAPANGAGPAANAGNRSLREELQANFRRYDTAV